MPFKTFANLTELPQEDLNMLMRQTVVRFDDAADRSAAIAAPDVGMLTYLEDIDEYQTYNGTAWVRWSSPLTVHATADRPSATLGAGHGYFDSTLGYPLWSNGTAWVTAAGVVS